MGRSSVRGRRGDGNREGLAAVGTTPPATSPDGSLQHLATRRCGGRTPLQTNQELTIRERVGSTFHTVFVDFPDMTRIRDAATFNRALYVTVTREHASGDCGVKCLPAWQQWFANRFPNPTKRAAP
jgi:hypothetical protein